MTDNEDIIFQTHIPLNQQWLEGRNDFCKFLEQRPHMVRKPLEHSVITGKDEDAWLDPLLECHVHRVCREGKPETTMEEPGILVTAPLICSFHMW